MVRALVLPNYELANDGKGGANYIAFLAALGSHAELMPLIAEYFDGGIERSMDVLARVTPHLPTEVRELRMAIAKDLVNRLLGQPNGQVRLWSEARSPGSTSDMLTVLTDVIVGIFQADVTPKRRVRRTRRGRCRLRAMPTPLRLVRRGSAGPLLRTPCPSDRRARRASRPRRRS